MLALVKGAQTPAVRWNLSNERQRLMGRYDATLSYEDFLHAFKDALDRVLAGQVVPPAFAMFDVALTLALLDIARAVHEQRPAQPHVSRACVAFATCASGYDRKVVNAPRSMVKACRPK
jgi:hypothetical protein